MEYLSLSAVLRLVGLWLLYRIGLALYNISPWHPLSRFPGPKIAAASYIYEAYYDWYKGGRYGMRIKAMHARYGPIVRINPDELHCSDPYFVDEIYAGPTRPRDKWQHQLNTGGASPVSVTAFSAVSHDLHRIRRQPFAKFFSRQQVLRLESEVFEFATLTADKILATTGKVWDIKQAFNCFTADIISQYAFGEPMGFIAQEGWEPNFATWCDSFFKSAYMMRHNAVARTLATAVPFVANWLGEDVRRFMHQMTVVIPGYIKAAMESEQDNGRVFADVIRSGTLAESESDMYHLSGEGTNLLLAGTETTAGTLTMLTYWLLVREDIRGKLMRDLEGLTPETIKWAELEQRPYMWAVIQEALRMTPGVTHRSARIARGEDLVYKSRDGKTQWVVPKGTPIGMTSMINHWDEELFPEPDAFRPERWLVNGKPNFELKKYSMSFGKGTRSCIGEQWVPPFFR